MANLFQKIMGRSLLKKGGNLHSFENPYKALKRLGKRIGVGGIVDVGASHGRVSKKLMQIFPAAQIYAFEPHSMYKDRLLELADMQPNFHPYFYGLSDKKGSATLNITESPGNTSLLIPNARIQDMFPEESRVKQTIDIDIITLDEWNVDLRRSIEIIKLDIQGNELKALQGAEQTLRKSVSIVYTEIMFNPLYEGAALYSEIDLWLRAQGFILYNLYKPRMDKNGMLIWANAIFIRADIFN